MKWYYWAIVFVVLILMYALLIVRQKRQEKKNKEILDSFKVEDKVITHIGIYGKIKRIYETTYGKVCVLEIGVQNKIDVEMDFRYIAGKDEKTFVSDQPVKTEPAEQEIKETEKNKDVETTAEKKKNKK